MLKNSLRSWTFLAFYQTLVSARNKSTLLCSQIKSPDNVATIRKTHFCSYCTCTSVLPQHFDTR